MNTSSTLPCTHSGQGCPKSGHLSHEKNSKTSQKRGCGPCIVQQDHPPIKIRWRRMILMRQTGQLCRRLEQRRHMHICPQGTTATCVAPSDIKASEKMHLAYKVVASSAWKLQIHAYCQIKQLCGDKSFGGLPSCREMLCDLPAQAYSGTRCTQCQEHHLCLSHLCSLTP